MPCFKGLAVSIHTPDGPIPEHSVQKQSRQSRISTYIPVPPAKVPAGSTTGIPEQSTFAISITLLTPGLSVPYSTPKPTADDPYPHPRAVGGLPGYSSERGQTGPSVPPYIPRTTNPNETIAAYIYFDGRAKEEVATLLRRGEETWVNSRWVSVQGGGLAEREFLFREVGLERWLNGLDLEGSNKEKQQRIERRQRRLEKKQRIKKEEMDSDDEKEHTRFKRVDRNGVLRYGGEGSSPVEDIADDSGLLSSASDSEDEPPQPEAAGQIKVALFRVLASGEIKRGEYSPQFDAQDDDDGMENGNGDGGDGDIDHTTSFAKPKSLDPKTISTQTVTGLDPPESPYAVFTFFYRGEKQLRKMGILEPDKQKTPIAAKRKSSGPDFSKFGPLKSTGTVGFSGYRDPSNAKRKNKGEDKDADAMDSDADDEDEERLPQGSDVDIKHENGNSLLSPEDAKRTGELSEGVQKIKLKRQHSADPVGDAAATRKSPHLKSEETDIGTPQSVNSTSANAGTPPDSLSPAQIDAGDVVSSPFKRHRSSMPGLAGGVFGSNTNDAFLPSTSFSNTIKAEDASQQRAASTPEVKLEEAHQAPPQQTTTMTKQADSDEEL
ncbi:hypothetical protein M409DRAFT_54422 [Zasmidium cellare ATCC 36951]|uniref:DUF7918 domain-containing protein n=1 Tax=Zasmidium cellare ATCC 36951 TaxID=1080233 RepID=A0A6A6CP28_ZASCE|nr:uncharacterized protein M409DRAFT_54422 [Zasmidium cellare ATCC 36951]KAF2167236.1 hypothetical protein M409DRAFT_54422 [Zasmidium cellare ATCC 36951]